MNNQSNIWTSARSAEYQGMVAERDSANMALVRLCKLTDGNQSEDWFDKISESINQLHDALEIMNNAVDELEGQLPADAQGMIA